MEDAAKNWAPSPGPIKEYIPPEGPWVRLDSGVAKGDEVSVYYDPMIANWWCGEWTEMIPFVVPCKRLEEFHIAGITTTIPFMKAVLKDDDFCNSKNHNGIFV